MFARIHRQGTQPRTAAPRAGTRPRRIAAVLAAVTTGLLASAVAIPAAFARDVPGGYGPVPATTVHAATTGGLTGGQIALITLIALIAAVAVAAVTVLRHRAVPSPAA